MNKIQFVDKERFGVISIRDDSENSQISNISENRNRRNIEMDLVSGTLTVYPFIPGTLMRQNQMGFL